MTVLQVSLDTKMKKVLFVCTGNTCRSPMAEAVFNHLAKEKSTDFIAISRGLYADGVSSVSNNAKTALCEKGIPCDHVSTQLSSDDVNSADYIFGLTTNHGQAIISAFPQAKDKVYAFPYDISDPYGGNLETYRMCLEEIYAGVEKILNALTENKDER